LESDDAAWRQTIAIVRSVIDVYGARHRLSASDLDEIQQTLCVALVRLAAVRPAWLADRVPWLIAKILRDVIVDYWRARSRLGVSASGDNIEVGGQCTQGIRITWVEFRELISDILTPAELASFWNVHVVRMPSIRVAAILYGDIGHRAYHRVRQHLYSARRKLRKTLSRSFLSDFRLPTDPPSLIIPGRESW
jgi:hypothetical protein